MQTHFRACPLCEAICGLEIHHDGNRLSAIRGDMADPFSRGHICPKGNAILDLEVDPDRLRQPQLKVDGRFVPIGWDEALQRAGEGFAAIQARYGGDSVAAYVGNPNVHHFGHIAYVPQWLRLLKTRNIYSASSVDQWPHQLVAWAMFGHQFLIPIVDLDRTDFLLMLGANPAASNGSLLTAPGIAKRLKALTQRGSLVVVDPRRTETAELASTHLAIRPGADALLLIALLQRLQDIGPARLAAYGERLAGFDQALKALPRIDDTELETRTGLSTSAIDRLAASLYAAERAAVYGRMGVSTQRFGTLCQWLIQLVNLYLGQLNREGGVLPNDPVLPVTGKGTSPGHRDRWRSRVRGLPEFAGELPVAALAEEIDTPGDGQVRALFTSAGNPVLSTPAGHRLSDALKSLEFMVSMDIYINETTCHADLILPPTSFLTQFHYDSIFNAFAVRRVARINRPLYPQPDSERADYQIVNGMAAAYAQAAGKSWTAMPAPEALIDTLLARAGRVDLGELKQAEHGLDLGPLVPSLLDRLETPSGKIECWHPFIAADLARLSCAPASASLQLIGRRDVRSNNSWMHNAPRLIKGKPRHQLLMNPADLARLAIADGARVRISSAAGSIETDVLADAAIREGVASLPHGFGHNGTLALSRANQLAGASYNDLSDPAALDEPSGNAALNGLSVVVTAL
jgi:anaerobic selenocysteine-containing dehydrogenase